MRPRLPIDYLQTRQDVDVRFHLTADTDGLVGLQFIHYVTEDYASRFGANIDNHETAKPRPFMSNLPTDFSIHVPLEYLSEFPQYY